MYRVGSFEFSAGCIEKCPVVHQGVCAAIAKLALNPNTDAGFSSSPTHEAIADSVRDAFEPNGAYEYARRCVGPVAIGGELITVWQCGREKTALEEI